MTFKPKRQRSNQLCACGCGEYTLISKQGKPNKYLHGHNHKVFTVYTGENHYNWKGGKCKSSDGYIIIWQRDHPYKDARGYVRQSHLVVEKIIGKYLPKQIIVHHLNGIKTDDRPKNLVVCEDQTYHMLLHQRTEALKTCGHADWRKCPFCQQYDDPKNMYISPNKKRAYHRECRQEYKVKNRKKINQRQQERRAKKR